MNPLRRRFLGAGSGATLLSWIGTGLLLPTRSLASEWNKPAFTARTIAEALKAQGSQTAAESRDITINAPEIAENGAKVEVEIVCSVPNVRSLALFADKNPMPLCATLEFAPTVLPYARIQIKLAETTRVRAVARGGDGKNYVAMREIKVTLGGCGG